MKIADWQYINKHSSSSIRQINDLFWLLVCHLSFYFWNGTRIRKFRSENEKLGRKSCVIQTIYKWISPILKEYSVKSEMLWQSSGLFLNITQKIDYLFNCSKWLQAKNESNMMTSTIAARKLLHCIV